MRYWKTEVYDYSGSTLACIQRLVGRGTDEQFVSYLQGAGVKAESSGMWTRDMDTHGVEVSTISAAEFLAYRSHSLLVAQHVSDLAEDEQAHDFAEFYVNREMPSEIFDIAFCQQYHDFANVVPLTKN